MIVGNSSAGIREAPFYGIPTINVGSRQNARFQYDSIINVPPSRDAIRKAIDQAFAEGRQTPSTYFGDGHSSDRFKAALDDKTIWEIPVQKQFCDI